MDELQIISDILDQLYGYDIFFKSNDKLLVEKKRREKNVKQDDMVSQIDLLCDMLEKELKNSSGEAFFEVKNNLRFFVIDSINKEVKNGNNLIDANGKINFKKMSTILIEQKNEVIRSDRISENKSSTENVEQTSYEGEDKKIIEEIGKVFKDSGIDLSEEEAGEVADAINNTNKIYKKYKEYKDMGMQTKEIIEQFKKEFSPEEIRTFIEDAKIMFGFEKMRTQNTDKNQNKENGTTNINGSIIQRKEETPSPTPSPTPPPTPPPSQSPTPSPTPKNSPTFEIPPELSERSFGDSQEISWMDTGMPEIFEYDEDTFEGFAECLDELSDFSKANSYTDKNAAVLPTYVTKDGIIKKLEESGFIMDDNSYFKDTSQFFRREIGQNVRLNYYEGQFDGYNKKSDRDKRNEEKYPRNDFKGKKEQLEETGRISRESKKEVTQPTVKQPHLADKEFEQSRELTRVNMEVSTIEPQIPQVEDIVVSETAREAIAPKHEVIEKPANAPKEPELSTGTISIDSNPLNLPPNSVEKSLVTQKKIIDLVARAGSMDDIKKSTELIAEEAKIDKTVPSTGKGDEETKGDSAPGTTDEAKDIDE